MRRPSPALIFACIGLFVALGGAAMGATHYLVTSTRQLSPQVLRALRGARGEQGPAGPAGSSGASGAVKLTYVSGSLKYQSGGKQASAKLSCPSGSLPLGASGTVTTNTQLNVSIGKGGFQFSAGSDSVDAGTATLYGVCASGPGLSGVSQQGMAANGPPPAGHIRSRRSGAGFVFNTPLANAIHARAQQP